MKIMAVEPENSSGMMMEVSLTPEIYYLLSDQDRLELDDPRTRRKLLNKMESEAFFEHEDLSQLELYLVREDKKREQARGLQGSNIEFSAKNAVIQRYLQRRTTQEEEEDERIRQREIREAIEEENNEEEESEDEAEMLRRAEQLLIRMATLALLERRLEEARERLGGGGGATVEEVGSSEEDSSQYETTSDSSSGTTSGTSTVASRRKTEIDSDNPDAIVARPGGTGPGSRRSSMKDRKKSKTGSEANKAEDKDKKKNGCNTGFWDCVTCCF